MGSYGRCETCSDGHASAEQLRRAANQRYPQRNACIIPGSSESHTSGRAHQTSRARATAASAPPDWLPSESKKRISRSRSVSDKPRSAPTRGSCRGATPSARFSRMGSSHRAIRVQKRHFASKNSQPRAWRPLPSVNSELSEIMFSVLDLPELSIHQPAALVLFEPSSVMTLPRNFETPFNAPVGMRRTSSNKPVMVVRNSSMLSSRSRV